MKRWIAFFMITALLLGAIGCAPKEEPWLNAEKAELCTEKLFQTVTIEEIHADYMLATAQGKSAEYKVKLNGTPPEDLCAGDEVMVFYENAYIEAERNRVEVDLKNVGYLSSSAQAQVAYKPVIYLYPEEETAVTVRLKLQGDLTCAYPAYREGWRVTAQPDGTLRDAAGQLYNYLYWEGTLATEYDWSKGFCVRGADTAAFLEDALARLGLNRREANEFIVYWLPQMEQNPYNIIAFQTERYTDAAALEISPAPDTLIRVFMSWKAAKESIALPPQALNAPTRSGFTAIEWGGAEVK